MVLPVEFYECERLVDQPVQDLDRGQRGTLQSDQVQHEDNHMTNDGTHTTPHQGRRH